MTREEAIKTLKITHCKGCNDYGDCETCYIGMAIADMEKQIPKKPSIEGDGYADGQLVYDTWICPNCEKHYEIDYDDYDYCPNCGQKIDKSFMDWSEEDD